MKILLVSNMYPSEQYPSYGIFVKNHVELLRQSNIKVDLIILNKMNNKIKKIGFYLIHYIKIWFYMIFKEYDYLYVHYASHNALPILIGNLLKKRAKIIVNVHGSDVIPEKNFQHKINFLAKWLLKISDVIVVPSQYFKEVVIEKYQINNKEFFISPSGGVNSNIFKKQRPSENILGLTKKYRYLGYVGRIDKDKGWDDLLKAFAKLIESKELHYLKLIMVGNGNDVSKRNELIKELGVQDKVILIDLLPQEKLSEIYNSIDVFIFPTRRKGESLGLVGIEAMACGTPVIGTNIGGLKSYIKDNKNGMLFDPGNIDELVYKINMYLNFNDKKIKKMEKCALETAKSYDQEIVKNNFKDFIINLYSIS